MFRFSRLISPILVFALLLFAGLRMVSAETRAPATLYVASTGENGLNTCTNPLNPCKTIDFAYDTALANDTIRIAAGSYVASLILNKNITFVGDKAANTIWQPNFEQRVAFIGGIGNSVTAHFEDLTLRADGPYAGNGGIVNVAVGHVSFDEVILENGDAMSGGAINLVIGSVRLTGSLVRNNHAQSEGGALFGFGDFTLVNTRMEGNSADLNGGAIFGSFSSNVIIEQDSSLNGNEAPTGGNLYVLGDSAIISDSTIANGTASVGAGIFNAGDSHLTIYQSTLVNNRATTSGGALYNVGVAIASSTIFTGNQADGIRQATSEGGAIRNIVDAHLTLNASQFTHNSSYDGGGIRNSGILTMTDSNMLENIGQYGGALNNSGVLTVIGGNLRQNSAEEGGGLWQSSFGVAMFDAVSFIDNEYAFRGGAIYNNGTLELIGSFFALESDGARPTRYAKRRCAAWWRDIQQRQCPH